MTAAPALANEQIHALPFARIKESPFNHRRRWGDLEELATSFKSAGVLQPVVVRRVGDDFELVFGHRRKRAGQLAKLDILPGVIRVMSDAQVKEAQAIENIQREDPHPMDEAEAFEQLGELGWSAEDISAKIGKSRSYVFERLKLLELCPKLRDAFVDDAFGASIAIALARIPGEKLQIEAWKRIQVPKWEQEREGGEPVMSARRALKVIQDEYMLRLDQAPFDRGDAELVPAAGSCKDCPKRTGNQRELFADVKSPDVCTDPACFDGKRKAHMKAEAARLEEKGVAVLKGEKPSEYSPMQPPQGFTKLAETFQDWQGSEKWRGKGYGAIIKAAGLSAERERTVMLDEKGKTVELVKTSLVNKALSKVGARKKEKPAPSRKTSPKEQAEHDARKKARTMVEKIRASAAKAIAEKARKAGTPGVETWRLMAHGLQGMYGWHAKGDKAKIAKAGVEECVAICLEELLNDDYEGELLVAAADAYGVDLQALEQEADAKKAAKRAKGKGGGKPARKAGKK